MIERLIGFLQKADGKYDKAGLSVIVKQNFDLIQDRSVFSCSDFSIRFCHASKKKPSNTVASLSKLRNYDNRPFIVCIVTPNENFLLLANTTFLLKISHSSQQLRIDNIKGSFNVSDITRIFNGIENKPENFEKLFYLHKSIHFEENLVRLVETSSKITPNRKRFEPNAEQREIIKEAPARAIRFISSKEYIELENDLRRRLKKVQNEIAKAVAIENVNLRGRIIEYLITSDDGPIKEQIIDCLRENNPIPEFKTEDDLADYRKDYESFSIAIEIKTKILSLNSNPKGYNIDKLLAFLSKPNNIYMIYIVGLSNDGYTNAVLCSVFDKRLLENIAIQYHWGGRNSSGITQFKGNSLLDILNNPQSMIDIKLANNYIEKLLALLKSETDKNKYAPKPETK